MCLVDDCVGIVVSNGLCDKHRKRMSRHGTLETTRPADWGQREKHPLWNSYKSAQRSNTLCKEWYDDFWLFVLSVGDRPENHILRRINLKQPFSISNFKWVPKLQSIKDYKDKNSYMRDYFKRNPEKQKNHDLKKKYGITLEEFKQKQIDQNNVCAICGNPEVDIDKRLNKVRELAVDHNHTTGQIRGLLCRGCNQGLGNFQEDTKRLQKAIEYLYKYKEEEPCL